MLQRIADGLQSLATRLGTSADKAATVSYTVELLEDQQLEAAFRTSWAMNKAVTIPALDATRKWREWSGANAKVIETFEDLWRIKAKVLEAKWKARLYGGAGILIGIKGQELAEPLNPRTVRRDGLEYLTVLTRKEIMAGIAEIDPREARYGLPRYYEISTNTGVVLRVDPSRLVEFRGEPLPSHLVAGSTQYGWGDSVLQSVFEACRNLDATMANIASLVFDAKTDVVKIPELMKNLADPRYEEALIKRFSTARMLKGNNGTLLLDKQDEYESKSYSFGGLHDIADRFMQVAAGAADIPITRFLGQSPGGLNSTGENDLLNYYDRVQAMQTLEIEPAMTVLDEVIVRSATGDATGDDTYEWRPLHQMTEAQRSEIRARDAETVSKIASAGIYADEDVRAMGVQLFRENGVDTLKIDSGFDEDVDPLTGDPIEGPTA
jgi:phage-related protein (TIGR01555 family)